MSAEIMHLLAAPPDWLDPDGPMDMALSPMRPQVQRGRDKRLRYAWRWECAVRGPKGSAYEGQSYRVLVRLPVGYPRVPPKLQILSIISHLEVETRDPYEGHLEESFYERLEERMIAAVAAATPQSAASSNAASNGTAAAAEVPPPPLPPPTDGAGAPALRFGLGERVRCLMELGKWKPGVVVALNYREEEWEAGRTAPYQVALDDGRVIYASVDTDSLICRDDNTSSDPDAAAAAGVTYTVRGALELLVEALHGPLPDPSLEMEEEEEEAAAAAAVEAAEEEVEEAVPVVSTVGAVAEEQAVETASAPAANAVAAAEVVRVVADGTAGTADAAHAEASAAAAAEAAAIATSHLEELLFPDGFPDGGATSGDATSGDAANVPTPVSSPVPPGAAESAASAYRRSWMRVAEGHADELATMRAYRSMCVHPELFEGVMRPEWLAPSFASAWREGQPSAAALRSLAEEVSPGIFAFDLLSPSFCEQLLCELDNFEASGLPVARPNSMNNYGVILNLIGMENMMDSLQRTYIRPLAQALFPIEGEHLDHHHSFMVQYKQGEDLGLDMHTDACDVTLNCCLGKEFTGAGLTFCGKRGDADGLERKFTYRHKHVKGRALLHLGHHRHGADDIITGERFNLIVWNKSSTFRVSQEFMSKYAVPPSTRGIADIECLSYTHDADYEDYQPYPPGKRPRPRGG